MYSYNWQTIRHPYAYSDDTQSEEQGQSPSPGVARKYDAGNDYFSGRPPQASTSSPTTPISAPPIPRHPPSLMPGRSLHGRRPPDLPLWNSDAPANGISRHPSSPPLTAPIQRSHTLRSSQSYCAPPRAPPRPQHRTSVPSMPPIIPPKVPVHDSEMMHSAVSHPWHASEPVPPVPPLPPSPQATRASFPTHDHRPPRSPLPSDDAYDGIAFASSSQAEAGDHGSDVNQVEEELSKVLRNSTVLSDTSPHDPTQSTTGSPRQSRAHYTSQDSTRNTHEGAEAMYVTSSPEAMYFPVSTPPRPASLVTLEPPADLLAQLEADEAFARQLAAEEELATPQHPNQDEDEAFARRLAEEEHNEQYGTGHSKPDPDKVHHAELPSYHEAASSSVISDESAHSSASMGPNRASVYNISTPSEVSSTDSTPHLSRSPSDPSSAEEKRSRFSPALEIGPTSAPMSPSQFVDAELLAGVSLSFAAPVISQRLIAFGGPMPNIISLPYGRCPPLHVQAPNWRHLLKLLARLGATRIEPTVEALAVNRSELQLRTVIQFVRTHHQSNDWRTVIWLTLDHPVPSALPGAFKFTSGDVNTLPFSYTLSNLPTLLRDSADTHMSKAYTVPSTPNIPFPVLPMTFPNLAMYLQAVLDESRRHTGDGSSGVRKLAKMLDTCYPSSPREAALYPPENPSSVGSLFKRVIGRGNRNSKKTTGTNEDTYEFITPFRPDEWGS